MRKSFILLFLVLSFSLYAGDAASFVNLGFSSDSQYFMFGQYGVSLEEGTSYSDAYIIDVDTNRYAKGGRVEKIWNVVPGLGVDAVGGLFNVVRENNWMIKKYGINHINNGKTVYFLADGEMPDNDLSFRVFSDDSKLKAISAVLKQGTEGKNKQVKSWFDIEVALELKNGTTKKLKIGHPEIKRAGVLAYYIKNIVVSPDLKSLIFIIAKKVEGKKGFDIRFMVETISID